ncbi:UDP-glucosyltransferase 2-like [Mytilus edulis]|uniref:UDP-glucosyltransferase 2-like n=1 Tax=Mytilus edulis TaxID=6550 RepID=UPI0039EE264D
MPALWSGYIDKMTFLERMINIVLYNIHLIKPTMPSFGNLVAIYLMDYPIPIASNAILCGGLAARPVNSLISKIETFVEKSKDDLVIVAFEKGYGISMDILDFSVNELVDNINEVVHNSNFMFSIKNASEIFHSRPQTPTQKEAYWIDLVTKYGTEHFRPASLDIQWYSYFMVDVYLIYILGLGFVVYSFKLFLKFCIKICCRKKNAKEKLH